MSDTFRTYLNSIGRFPLLTPEQEIELSRKIKCGLDREEALGERSKQELKTIRIGKRAKEKLIQCNLRLVVNIAKKYSNIIKNTNIELDDLIQEGCIGLNRAVEKYDGTRGYKFSTYAYWWIKQAITRCTTAQSRLIRIPGNQLEQINKMYYYQIEFEQIHHRKPTLQELCEFTGKPRQEILLWLERLQGVGSLDKTNLDDGLTMITTIPDPASFVDPLDSCSDDEQMQKILDALDQLKDLEYEIVSRYCFTKPNSRDSETLASIGREIGLGRERVRIIKEKALRKIKMRVSHW